MWARAALCTGLVNAIQMWSGPEPIGDTWDTLVYCARYGHQQIDYLRSLTRGELIAIQARISKIITDENKPPAK